MPDGARGRARGRGPSRRKSTLRELPVLLLVLRGAPPPCSKTTSAPNGVGRGAQGAERTRRLSPTRARSGLAAQRSTNVAHFSNILPGMTATARRAERVRGGAWLSTGTKQKDRMGVTEKGEGRGLLVLLACCAKYRVPSGTPRGTRPDAPDLIRVQNAPRRDTTCLSRRGGPERRKRFTFQEGRRKGRACCCHASSATRDCHGLGAWPWMSCWRLRVVFSEGLAGPGRNSRNAENDLTSGRAASSA